MLVKEAMTIIHSLSEPSKMPGYGYGLPTSACKTGSILRVMFNTVCSVCYACTGHYMFGPTVKAHNKRLLAILHPLWVEAMITALKGIKVRWFRWHDSGDLQSEEHLEKIVAVAEGRPDMKFWLPTKEKGILLGYFRKHRTKPDNLCIRLSATKIDGMIDLPASLRGFVQTCSVHNKFEPEGFECTSYERGGKCGDCRACWDETVKNVSYKKH